MGHPSKNAYRPWQPPAFDAAAPAPSTAANMPNPEVSPPPAALATEAPGAAELQHLRDEARQAGYAAGFEEGSARGRQEAQRLSALVDRLEQALTRVDAEVADELLALSVEIARLMLRRELAHRPEGVVDIVREALAQLPQHHALIHLHPNDAALVRSHLGEQLGHAGHRIVDDDRITPGGCRIEATGSQIDASLQTRWRRILQNLGRTETGWDVGPKA